MRLAGFGTAAAAPATKRRRNQSKLLDILFYSHFFFSWLVCLFLTYDVGHYSGLLNKLKFEICVSPFVRCLWSVISSTFFLTIIYYFTG